MAMRHGAVAIASCRGKPANAVEYRELEAMDFNPDDTEPMVKIKMAYAAIHPSDCNVLEGTYVHKVKYFPSAPIGYEGSGYVAALSKGAKELGTLKEGDLVCGKPGAMRSSLSLTGGMWATEIVSHMDGILKVPENLSAQQAAFVGVNPATAYWMLKNPKANLKPGMWVIQNLGNSAVGCSVCAVAKKMGIRTCSLVRREDAIPAVKAAGGDVVVAVDFPTLDPNMTVIAYNEEREKQLAAAVETIKKAVAEVDPQAKFMSAFDGVGSTSGMALLKMLSPGGMSQVYGAMSREPMQVSSGQIIFKALTIDGFLLWSVMPNAPTGVTLAEWEDAMKFLLDVQADFPTTVQKVYPLAEVKDAVNHAFSGSRDGKILLKCNDDVP